MSLLYGMFVFCNYINVCVFIPLGTTDKPAAKATDKKRKLEESEATVGKKVLKMTCINIIPLGKTLEG